MSPRVARKVATVQELLQLPLDGKVTFSIDPDGKLLLLIDRGAKAAWHVRADPTADIETVAHKLASALLTDATLYAAGVGRIVLEDNKPHAIASTEVFAAIYKSGLLK